MPGGLPEVTQKVGGDASAYIAAYRQMRGETAGLISDNRELMRTVAEVQSAIRASSGGGGSSAAVAADIARQNAAIREQLAVLRENQAAISAAKVAAGFGDVHAEVCGDGPRGIRGGTGSHRQRE